MELTKMIEDNIAKYAIKKDISPELVEITKTDAGYIAKGNITKSKLNGFNKFLSNQRKIDNILTLIMKKKYGTWQKMEKEIGKKSFHQTVKRWIKNSNKILDNFDCEIFIKSKNTLK